MRLLYLILAGLLVAGCIDLGERGNQTNVSQPNVTNITNDTVPAPKEWTRYQASGFSFEYPSNMDVQESKGIFTGTHTLKSGTGEMLVVVYVNTVETYGENRDKAMRETPSQAASDLLKEDLQDDPAQLLDKAYEIGNITTYAISRDAQMAEVPFRIRFSDSETRYHGYALSLYAPERSLHAKIRIIAIDPSKAEAIRDNFLNSFRVG